MEKQLEAGSRGERGSVAAVQPGRHVCLGHCFAVVLCGFDGPGVLKGKEQKLELSQGRVIGEFCLILGLLKLVTFRGLLTYQMKDKI